MEIQKLKYSLMLIGASRYHIWEAMYEFSKWFVRKWVRYDALKMRCVQHVEKWCGKGSMQNTVKSQGNTGIDMSWITILVWVGGSGNYDVYCNAQLTNIEGAGIEHSHIPYMGVQLSKYLGWSHFVLKLQQIRSWNGRYGYWLGYCTCGDYIIN